MLQIRMLTWMQFADLVQISQFHLHSFVCLCAFGPIQFYLVWQWNSPFITTPTSPPPTPTPPSPTPGNHQPVLHFPTGQHIPLEKGLFPLSTVPGRFALVAVCDRSGSSFSSGVVSWYARVNHSLVEGPLAFVQLGAPPDEAMGFG